jgi:fructose-1-phosphate kinase PfkB-like protein
VAALAARTGGTVIVTDGAAGSTGTDGATTLTATAPAVDGGYPVGSGDTYLGALLAALDGDANLGEAMRLATGAALANVRAPGAAVFTPEEAARHAAQVSLTTL